MARKKRTVEVPETQTDSKEKIAHTDVFQKKGTEAVTSAIQAMEGKGKNFLKGLIAVAVIAVIAVVIYAWTNRSNEAGQAALGKAIETVSAPISATPAAGSTEKSFKSEKERAEAAVKAFDDVASKFGGDIAKKAKYFSATQKLVLDRAAGLAELESISKEGGEVGSLAKFALAQAKNTDGKSDESLALYRELASAKDSVVPKDTVNFEIAKILEKQGKKDEAVEAYFQIAKAASELKDKDGAGVPLSQTAREAKEKVQELNPEKAKEIPEPATPAPLGL